MLKIKTVVRVLSALSASLILQAATASASSLNILINNEIPGKTVQFTDLDIGGNTFVNGEEYMNHETSFFNHSINSKQAYTVNIESTSTNSGYWKNDGVQFFLKIENEPIATCIYTVASGYYGDALGANSLAGRSDYLCNIQIQGDQLTATIKPGTNTLSDTPLVINNQTNLPIKLSGIGEGVYFDIPNTGKVIEPHKQIQTSARVIDVWQTSYPDSQYYDNSMLSGFIIAQAIDNNNVKHLLGGGMFNVSTVNKQLSGEFVPFSEETSFQNIYAEISKSSDSGKVTLTFSSLPQSVLTQKLRLAKAAHKKMASSTKHSTRQGRTRSMMRLLVQ